MIEVIEKVWAALSPFQAQIIAFALTLTAALLTHFFRAKVKLIFGHTNNSFHKIQTDQGPVNIYCEKHYIQNVGWKPAEKIEIAFSNPPSELSVYPPRSFERINGPDGQFMLKIPYLAPTELVIVDTIHVNHPTAELRAVHCPESVGKKVNFWVLRRFNPNFYRVLMALLVLGLFYSIQLVIGLAALIFRVNA